MGFSNSKSFIYVFTLTLFFPFCSYGTQNCGLQTAKNVIADPSPETRVMPGGSTQIFMEGIDPAGLPTKADAVLLSTDSERKDFVLNIKSPERSLSVKKININESHGLFPAVQFAFEPENMLSNRLGNMFVSTNFYDDVKTATGELFTPKAESRVLIENLRELFGVQFIASSDIPRNWKLNLETDFSRELAQKLGKPVSYQAQFESNQLVGYVTLPLSKFEAVIDGVIHKEIPGIATSGYGKRQLNLKSIGFEAANNTPGSLTVHGGEVGLGFVYGAEFNQAKKMLSQTADYYEHGYLEDLPKYPSRFKDPRRFELVDDPKRTAKAISTVVRLMERMGRKLESFPELEDFRYPPENERIPFLNKILSQWDFKVGESLTGNKVDLFEHVWSSVNFRKSVPLEKGYFATLHSRYGHAFQLIAMLTNSTPEELEEFRYLFRPTRPFLFNWAMIFDSRGGGANDPSSWRKFEIPK